MSGALLAILVLGAALALVAWPLIGRVPQGWGRGLEDDAPVTRWEAERARLIGAMRDNDLALAEGKLDAATHQASAARLSAEAEAVLKRLRKARGQFEPTAIDAPPRPRPDRVMSIAALTLTLAVALAAARFAGWQDLDLTRSPHADGTVPLDAPQVAVVAPPASDAPDIAAMVGRLEARVGQGDAPPDDIKMLLRSYDTLGRLDDARAVLVAALQRFPDDTDFQLGFLRAVISLPSPGDYPRALPVAERLIAAMPDLLEARWYRALLLAANGRRDEARSELIWLRPQLPPDSPAERAVAQLIDRLSATPG